MNLSALLDGVAPLAKGTTIACETRLARNADKFTEPINIMGLMDKAYPQICHPDLKRVPVVKP